VCELRASLWAYCFTSERAIVQNYSSENDLRSPAIGLTKCKNIRVYVTVARSAVALSSIDVGLKRPELEFKTLKTCAIKN